MKQYLYELNGISYHDAKLKWESRERKFKLLVVGMDLNDVLGKATAHELGVPICQSAYHNDVDEYPIHRVVVKHASLISEVDIA